jgi:hypothetical protein
MKVILKFRQVHVDRSHRIEAVFPNLIEELRHFAPVQFADELWYARWRVRDLKLGRKVRFIYQERPHEVAFIAAQIERKEVVYSVVLAARAKKPLDLWKRCHFRGELAKK